MLVSESALPHFFHLSQVAWDAYAPAAAAPNIIHTHLFIARPGTGMVASNAGQQVVNENDTIVVNFPRAGHLRTTP